MRGHDQIYGTLFVLVDGVTRSFWPKAHEAEVDDARRTIRLPTLAADRVSYKNGARPGPFRVPLIRRDRAVLNAHLVISRLRHGRQTRCASAHT